MEDYKQKGLSLRNRLLSAVIFLPIFIWSIYWKWNWAFLLLIMAISLCGLREYFKMMNQKGISCNRILGYLGVGLLPFLFSQGNLAYPSFLIMAIFISILISQLFSKEDLSYIIQRVSATLLGIIYVGWMPSHLLALKSLANGNNLIVYVFAVTWGGDTFAYFVGSNWGRHKFFSNISPHKTKEGVITGILGSVFAAFVFIEIFRVTPDHYTFYLVSGLIIGLIAVFGDLSESLLKRSIHIKDASHIIPGHGGILDRFDSIFFTAPLMYYLTIFFLVQ